MDVKIKKARDVLILSTADWDNPSWTNKQHMAVQFAQHGWRVLYVDSLGLRRPVLKKKDFLRIGKRLINGLKEAHEVRSSIWRISPLVLPFQKHAQPLDSEMDIALAYDEIKYKNASDMDI